MYRSSSNSIKSLDSLGIQLIKSITKTNKTMSGLQKNFNFYLLQLKKIILPLQMILCWWDFHPVKLACRIHWFLEYLSRL